MSKLKKKGKEGQRVMTVGEFKEGIGKLIEMMAKDLSAVMDKVEEQEGNLETLTEYVKINLNNGKGLPGYCG